MCILCSDDVVWVLYMAGDAVSECGVFDFFFFIFNMFVCILILYVFIYNFVISHVLRNVG